MKQLGLIGYPLSHSFSRGWFMEKFQKEGITGWTYELYPMEDISMLPDLVKNTLSLKGLNVTIPHKEAVLKYMDELSNEAKEIGAVNTIAIERTKESPVLKGFNTDAYAFERSLVRLLQPYHMNALVLGTGGASKAVQYVLKKLSIDFTLVSRSVSRGNLTYESITPKDIYGHSIIINATPVGMFPHVDDSPLLPYEAIGSSHLMYDLVYNPRETAFLKQGKEKGATVKNGLEMLQLQAEKAWEIWSRNSQQVSKAV